MAQFDFIGAVNAGISNEDIAKETGITNFDFTGAVGAGISNEDISKELKLEPVTRQPISPNSTFQAPPAPIGGVPYEEPSMFEKVGKGLEEVGTMLAPEPMRQAAKAGVGSPALGIARASENIANLVREVPDTFFTDWAKEHKLEIDRYNAENPDQVINASTIGDIAVSTAGAVVGQTPKLAFLVDSFIGALRTYGRGETAAEAAKVGTIEGTIGAGATKLANYLSTPAFLRGVGPRLKEVLKTKDDVALQEYLDMLNFAKDKDIKLFDAMINGDIKAIQSSNIFEKDQISKITKEFEVSELKAVGDILKKEVSTYSKLGEEFAEKTKTLRADYRAKEEAAYSAAKELGGDTKYNISSLQDKIVNMLREGGAEQSVINSVKRELFHLERTMGDEEKAVRKGLETARKKVQDIQKKLRTADSKQVGRLTAQLRAAQKQRDTLKGKVDEFLDTNYLDANQLMNTIKRINSDIFTRGGQSWGATDKAAKKFATDAKVEVENFLKTVKGEDSEFWKAYTEAKGVSRERFSLFGSGDKGTKDFPELAAALHTKDTEQLARTIVQANSSFKLRILQDTLGEELGNQFITKFIDKTIDLTPRGAKRGDELIQLDLANTSKLGANLSKLVDDKDNYQFLAKAYGEEAARDLKSLSKIANGLADSVEALRARKTELDKGLLNYMGEKGLIAGPLTVIKDAIGHIVNKATGKTPYTKTKELNNLIKGLEEHLGKRTKTPISKRLQDWATAWGETSKQIMRDELGAMGPAKELDRLRNAGQAKGIKLTYKLDEVISELAESHPNQRFSIDQLKGYLRNKGKVSPKEIEASSLFDSVPLKPGTNESLPISEWDFYNTELEGLSHRFSVYTRSGEDAKHSDLTLGGKGKFNDTYKTKEYRTRKKSDLSTGFEHSLDKELDSKLMDKESQLGWSRLHIDEINGKETTVLNEIQSDWLQAERKGKGTFKSTKRGELHKKANLLLRDVFDNKLSPKETEKVFSKIKELRKRAIRLKTGRETIIEDFPLSPKKFHQLMVVDAINEAITNGTKRVAIPIEREGELAGGKGVTEFYNSLDKYNTSVLPDIRKKLEGQGLRVKLSREKYEPSNKYYIEDEYFEDIEFKLDELGFDSEEVAEEFATKANIDVDDVLGKNLDDYLDYLQDNFPGLLDEYKTKGNTLHIIEIEEIPNTSVNWNAYSLLSSLGLAGAITSETKAGKIDTSSSHKEIHNQLDSTYGKDSQNPVVLEWREYAIAKELVEKYGTDESKIDEDSFKADWERLWEQYTGLTVTAPKD